jgi:hypothetical protein
MIGLFNAMRVMQCYAVLSSVMHAILSISLGSILLRLSILATFKFEDGAIDNRDILDCRSWRSILILRKLHVLAHSTYNKNLKHQILGPPIFIKIGILACHFLPVVDT